MRSSEFYMFKRNKFPFSDAIHQFEICNMNIIKNQYNLTVNIHSAVCTLKLYLMVPTIWEVFAISYLKYELAKPIFQNRILFRLSQWKLLALVVSIR